MKKPSWVLATAIIIGGLASLGGTPAFAAVASQASHTTIERVMPSKIVKADPTCSGEKYQVEWVFWPISYWEWSRQSNGKYTGLFHVYNGPITGWTTATYTDIACKK
ncbi:MAG: hypothetical protein LBE05_07420 [Microbacterium sp.]|jgi:hypothetical protein|nr:hypothetical protein [Microbacterium sp.]